MIYTPALFNQAVSDRRAWIETAQRELAQRGHTDPNLITYCENLFSDYGSTHGPKRAIARDLQP